MPLATRNNAIILKDGKLAEGCGCCGGWYCYDERGCCVQDGCATSFVCESECTAAGGVFVQAGSQCNYGTIVYPQLLYVTLTGSPPAILACPPTEVRIGGVLQANKDVLQGAQWSGTYSLHYMGQEGSPPGMPDFLQPFERLYRGPIVPTSTLNTVFRYAAVRCQIDTATSEILFSCRRIVATLLNTPTISEPQVGSGGAMIRGDVSAVSGNTRDGFSVPQNDATFEFYGTSGWTPTFCQAPPSTLSGMSISSLSVQQP